MEIPVLSKWWEVSFLILIGLLLLPYFIILFIYESINERL